MPVLLKTTKKERLKIELKMLQTRIHHQNAGGADVILSLHFYYILRECLTENTYIPFNLYKNNFNIF